ncbi:MAG: GntR family transcriptional regulator [Succiniclasticum sp.]|jgi:GntR family transcriptional regulator, rspAB operon transcriptional repressor
MTEAYIPEFSSDPEREGTEIYDVMRKAILDLYLCPGIVLSIRNLCEFYNVGRSPVRDAVKRLQLEGLITVQPQKGIMISLIDLHREAQERFMRVAVETEVMREFAARHTTEQLETARSLLQAQKQWLQGGDGDFRTFLRLDDNFHQYFYHAMDRDYCFYVLQQSSGFYRRMRLLCCQYQQMSENLRQHQTILEAVSDRSEERVQQALYHHLQKLSVEEKDLTEQYPYLFEGTAVRAASQDLGADYLQTIYATRERRERSVQL